MSAEAHREQVLHESIGWLVGACGRDFMLLQVERAGEYPEIAERLQGWANLESLQDVREERIMRATRALEIEAGYGVWEPGEAERWAEVALIGADVIRPRVEAK